MVHTVYKVDVDCSAGAEHHFSACGPAAAKGMAALVFYPSVAFCLYDAAADLPVLCTPDQMLTKEERCCLQCRKPVQIG
ncbi:hypothetical protein D3C81_2110310 [compost metagenome]